MKTTKIFKNTMMGALLTSCQISATTEISFEDIATRSEVHFNNPGGKYRSIPRNHTHRNPLDTIFTSRQGGNTMETLTNQLNSLVKDQHVFLEKYSVSSLSTNDAIAHFKVKAAFLEYQTAEVLGAVDHYLESDEYDQGGKEETADFSRLLDLEEDQRIKIEALSSDVKFKKTPRFYQNKIMFEIPLGN